MYLFRYMSLCCFIAVVCSERLHEQIYSTIEGGSHCFRRLNGTHQVGCSSSNKGAVGTVLMVQELNDAMWIVQNGTSGPYMAVVSTALFHDVVDMLINNPENVAGVVVYENANLSTSAFTHDSKCPNEYSQGPLSECSSNTPGTWNPKGTNLLKRDIPFPMLYLPESRFDEIKTIEKCYQRHNLDRSDHKGKPLCSIQLNAFMFAAVDSKVCLRRSASTTILTPTKVCDPLGDLNVYYILSPRAKESKLVKKPVVLVTARMDTASLFDGVSPGAASTVVGLVTLITAAEVLKNMIPPSKEFDTNVIFLILNGESFDYIGSQKIAYDITHREWPPVMPITENDIPLHVEVGQIGGALLSHKDDESWPLTAFAPTRASNADKIQEFVNDISVYLNPYNISVNVKATDNLPPSSLHTFRTFFGNATNSGRMTEILIVDHDKEFANMFYNSALDEYVKIGYEYRNISIGSNGSFISTEELIETGVMKKSDMQVKIAHLATSLAQALYKRISNEKYTGNYTATAHLVDEMLYCLLRSQACRLLLAADFAGSGSSAASLPRQPAPLYVGVAPHANTAPTFAGHLLALLTGERTGDNRTECDTRKDPEFTYLYLKGWNYTGVCIKTTMNFSQAISPAFVMNDYDLAAGVVSSWTESVWQSMWARVFVAAGGGGARAALASGAVATAVAAALTFWIQTNSQRIFVNAPSGSLVGSDAATGILRSVNC